MKILVGYLLETCSDFWEMPENQSILMRWGRDICALPSAGKPDEEIFYFCESGFSLPVLTENVSENAPSGGKEGRSHSVVLFTNDREWQLPEGYDGIYMKDGVRFSEAVQALWNCFTFFREWQLQLLNMISFHGDLQSLLKNAGQLTRNHIYVADMNYHVLAYTENTDIEKISATWRFMLSHGFLPTKVIKGLIETGEYEQINQIGTAEYVYSKNFNVPFVARSVFYNHAPQAHVFLVSVRKRPNYKDLVITENLVDLLETHFSLFSKFQLNRFSTHMSAFFRETLLGRPPLVSEVERQLSLFGWSLNNTIQLAITRIVSLRESEISMLTYETESDSGWLCCRIDQNMVFIRKDPTSELAGGNMEVPVLGTETGDYGRKPGGGRTFDNAEEQEVLALRMETKDHGRKPGGGHTYGNTDEADASAMGTEKGKYTVKTDTGRALPDTRDPDYAMLRQEAEKYGLKIGVGKIFDDFFESHNQYEQLSELYDIALSEQETRPVFAAREYAFYYILSEIHAQPRLYNMMDARAAKLLAWDRENGTEYFSTYFTYLKDDRNIVRTSRELNIHRNTLMYRLGKIREYIGVNEERMEERLHMLVSMILVKKTDGGGKT